MDIKEVIKLKQKAEEDIVNIIRNLNIETGVRFDSLDFKLNQYMSVTDGDFHVNLKYRCKLIPNLDYLEL